MKNLKNDAFRRKSYNYFLYNIKKLLTGRCCYEQYETNKINGRKNEKSRKILKCRKKSKQSENNEFKKKQPTDDHIFPSKEKYLESKKK